MSINGTGTNRGHNITVSMSRKELSLDEGLGLADGLQYSRALPL
jgi:hypothetical protein